MDANRVHVSTPNLTGHKFTAHTLVYHRSLDTVIDENTTALADQGFGVFNTIDIQTTTEATLDKDE